MDRVFIPHTGLPFEFLVEELPKAAPAEADTGDEDIYAMLANLQVAAMTGTEYQPPVEKPITRTLTKVNAPPPETPWMPEPERLLTPAAGAPLAKRAPVWMSSKKAARREKIEATIAGGGYWIRDFDEKGEIFRCYFSQDGEEETWGVAL